MQHSHRGLRLWTKRNIGSWAGAAALVLLTACGQGATPNEGEHVDPVVTIAALAAEVAEVVVTVTDSSGETNEYAAPIDPTTNTASVTVPAVPLGAATFEAHAYDSADVALYGGSADVVVAEDMDPVSLTVDRLTGSLAVTATVASGLDADEVVVATIGSVRGRLIVQGDGTATGTLHGIGTGSGLQIVVQSFVDGSVLRSGSSADVTVPHGQGAVTVVLTDVPADDSPPTVTGLTPSTVDLTAGEPFDLVVTATDPDDDLTTLSVNWGDGSPTDVLAATAGSATFTHTYTGSGSFTISAVATDGASNFSATESLIVDVAAAPSDSDVPVGVDTDQELTQVDLVATGIPSATTRVQAVITDENEDSTTVELVPGDDSWTGSVELLQGAQYDLSLVLDPGPGQTVGATTSFTVTDSSPQTVTVDHGDGDDPSEPALAATTSCTSATPVDGTCTVSVSIEDYTGSFDNFEVDLAFASDAFTLDSAAAGALTTGWFIVSGDSAGGMSTEPANGPGEFVVLTLVRGAAVADSLTLSGFVASGYDEVHPLPATIVLAE